ncbi:MAG: hypothetical protein HY069_03200 [Chlamydiia bacterium]|nr:hypothetical protein [Chlamydiia bacterium]
MACKRLNGKEIEDGLNHTFIYSGKGIAAMGTAAHPGVHDLVQYLLGRSDGFSLTEEIRQAILHRENRALLAHVREEFRAILAACALHLPKSEGEEKIFEAFVGNLIALIPYTYPEEGEAFDIPIQSEGTWKMARYCVDRKIALTPKWFSSPIVAYGLVAQEGPPILSFIGTTFPAGEGHVATLLADFTPGLSVGHAPYLFGRDTISHWLAGKSGVQVYGTSLGGALALHTLRHHSEQLAKVCVFNPAGLYPWHWWGVSYDTGPKVHIYYQHQDLVASMGSFPTGNQVSVYRVFNHQPEDFLRAHARLYTGSHQVMMLRSDAQYENGRFCRRVLTVVHFIASFILFPLILLGYLLSVVYRRLVENIGSRLS